MLILLFRIVCLCVGALLVLDALLPAATHTLKINGHDANSSMRGRPDNYHIYFDSVLLKSCSVDKRSYYELRNGEEVTVNRTRLFKDCTKVQRGDAEVYSNSLLRFIYVILGAGAIAYGIGWIKPEKWW
ncbi:MAG: hypothetical protein EOO68_27225 [Moraxellaceae bacterium]|nr:MAG: hypothetical protein EOO68_27225 [Moraxellaceae bacterium]